MTDGQPGRYPGAGDPYGPERDDRARRARPVRPEDIWGTRPGGPPPAPSPGPPWSPELGRGRLDPPGGPPGGRPVGAPPPSWRGAGPGQPSPPGAPGWDRGAVPGPVPPAHPGPHPDFGGGPQPEYPGQPRWAGQGAGPGRGGAPALGRYPPVGGYTDRDFAAERRGGQDPPADVWASPGAPAARGWQAGGPGMPGPQQGFDDPLYATQPDLPRAARQRIAATGGARVRRVWPRRLAVVALIAVAMVVCWYWVFPWLENILPSEF